MSNSFAFADYMNDTGIGNVSQLKLSISEGVVLNVVKSKPWEFIVDSDIGNDMNHVYNILSGIPYAYSVGYYNVSGDDGGSIMAYCRNFKLVIEGGIVKGLSPASNGYYITVAIFSQYVDTSYVNSFVPGFLFVDGVYANIVNNCVYSTAKMNIVNGFIQDISQTGWSVPQYPN